MSRAGSFQQIAPDRLRIQKGGGCLAAIGVPFLTAGVMLVFVLIRLILSGRAATAPQWSWLAFIAMGAAFAGAGVWLTFGRSWTTLDSTRGMIYKEWGLLAPMRRREYLAAEYSAVMLAFISGNEDRAENFPVILKARNNANLKLCDSATYAASRANATAVSKFLRLPLEDHTTDHVSVLLPEHAAQSLVQRGDLGTAGSEPARPVAMRSEVTAAGDGLRISIPARFSTPAIWSTVLGCAVMFGIVSMPAIRLVRQSGLAVLGILGVVLLVLPGLLLLGMWRKTLRKRTLVSVSASSGIEIEERGSGSPRITALAPSDILDLDFSTTESIADSVNRDMAHRALKAGQSPPQPAAWMMRLLRTVVQLTKNRGITVKCRQGLFTFGDGLPDEEIVYLFFAIKRALASSSAA